MTQYKLKKGIENFDVVDGAFAGRKFVRGKVYGEVPPEEKKKFDEIKPEVKGQKSEVGDQSATLTADKKTEIKNQKSKVRDQSATLTADKKIEIKNQKSKNRNP